MNKIAIAALSLGLLGAMSATHAAPVTIDAGNFEFTYHNEYLAGLSLSYADGFFTLSGPGLLASATGGANEVDVQGLSSSSVSSSFLPIVLTPKAGYQISGVTESVLGYYSASVGQSVDGSASVIAGLVSRWANVSGMEFLGMNVPVATAAVLTDGDAPAQGSFIGTGSLDFLPTMASLNLAPGAVALAALDVVVGAAASGNGSQASGVLTAYRLGVAVTPVPEPQAIGMLLAGLGVVGVVGVARGRRRTR